jgi:hypothetical protein
MNRTYPGSCVWHTTRPKPAEIINWDFPTWLQNCHEFLRCSGVLARSLAVNRLPNLTHGAHCLTRNVTEQVSANDWGGVTESARCRRWREGSAWARGARWCRRWRSATGRPSERRRGASSMSGARRRAGIASMRCAHFGDARLSCRARSLGKILREIPSSGRGATGSVNESVMPPFVVPPLPIVP